MFHVEPPSEDSGSMYRFENPNGCLDSKGSTVASKRKDEKGFCHGQSWIKGKEREMVHLELYTVPNRFWLLNPKGLPAMESPFWFTDEFGFTFPRRTSELCPQRRWILPPRWIFPPWGSTRRYQKQPVPLPVAIQRLRFPRLRFRKSRSSR